MIFDFFSYLRSQDIIVSLVKFETFAILRLMFDKNIFVSQNTESNDLNSDLFQKKSEISIESISVRNVIEKLAEHGIQCFAMLRKQ